MADEQKLLFPPRRRNHLGGARRVGVELEFASVSARAGAERAQKLFGGHLEEENPHRFHVRGTHLGDFRCELDLQYVHRSESGPEGGERPPAPLLERFDLRAREILGNVSSAFVPCEIVCPPLALESLVDLESLVGSLTNAGAAGTRSSPVYAFGAQINPEVACTDAEWIVSVFKSYLLLSDWLRAVMSIDPTRQLFSFADRFPAEFTAMVVHPDYWPDLERLMDDYLSANPTRNRELDLLPLFAWFDPQCMADRLSDPRINARPTFHYRLPDANFGEPGWGIIPEWNRWCLVERLADDRRRLDAMSECYLLHREKWFSGNWAAKASEWLLRP